MARGGRTPSDVQGVRPSLPAEHPRRRRRLCCHLDPVPGVIRGGVHPAYGMSACPGSEEWGSSRIGATIRVEPHHVAEADAVPDGFQGVITHETLRSPGWPKGFGSLLQGVDVTVIHE